MPQLILQVIYFFQISACLLAGNEDPRRFAPFMLRKHVCERAVDSTAARAALLCFASIAYDQAIEQTVNRDTKTTGGLRGILLNQGQFLH